MFIMPCAIGFGVQKYEVGQRWLVIAGPWDSRTQISTLLRYEVEGDRVIIGSLSGNGIGEPLVMSRETHDTYFPNEPFHSDGPDLEGNEIVRIEADSVSLEEFRAMVQGLFAGEPVATPTAALAATATEAPTSVSGMISPPDTGDAGLADLK
jgi:hypothetical protein